MSSFLFLGLMRRDALPFSFLAAKGRRYLDSSLFYHFVESDVSDCLLRRVHVRGEVTP